MLVSAVASFEAALHSARAQPSRVGRVSKRLAASSTARVETGAPEGVSSGDDSAIPRNGPVSKGCFFQHLGARLLLYLMGRSRNLACHFYFQDFHRVKRDGLADARFPPR